MKKTPGHGFYFVSPALPSRVDPIALCTRNTAYLEYGGKNKQRMEKIDRHDDHSSLKVLIGVRMEGEGLNQTPERPFWNC